MFCCAVETATEAIAELSPRSVRSLQVMAEAEAPPAVTPSKNVQFSNIVTTSSDIKSQIMSASSDEVDEILQQRSSESHASVKETKESTQRIGGGPPSPEKAVEKKLKSSEKSQRSFGLNSIPGNWSSPSLVQESQVDNEDLWNRYYQARQELEEVCEFDEEEEKKEEQIDSTEEYMCELRREFRAKWSATIMGAIMLKHTKQRVAKATFDETVGGERGQLKEMTVVSTIFSPYILPRAIQMCHRYFRRENNKDEEFFCTLHIQFVDMEEYVPEDDPTGDLYAYYWKPQLKQMTDICSNGYVDMPTSELGWRPIEEVDTNYLTPSLIRRIRTWLFGHFKSYELFNDMDMMRYLFGACGLVHEFNTLHGDIGHHWMATEEDQEEMKDYGNIKDADIVQASQVGTNWLEYQCRLVTGSLRSIDLWYKPYDQRQEKAQWGEDVLAYRYATQGYVEHDTKVTDRPWKIWERSLYGVRDDSLQNNVMGFIGSL